MSPTTINTFTQSMLPPPGFVSALLSGIWQAAGQLWDIGEPSLAYLGLFFGIMAALGLLVRHVTRP